MAKFTMTGRKVPNGTVLLMGVRYPGNTASTFTYALLKIGGLWYVTGSGKTPTAAGWGAIERWLERDNRELLWVRVMTDSRPLWPVQVDREHAGAGITCDICKGPCTIDDDRPLAGERRRGSEWRTKVRTPEDDALGDF